MLYDVVVIGGSFAGLSAAMHLARARRSVLVIDSGQPRNRFSPESHGIFALDGEVPGDLIDRARSQVERYPTAQTLAGAVVGAVQTASGFQVTTAAGEVVTARKLVLAFGISDILPEIPGLVERWGQSVLHCPYCHGFEYAGRKLGVLQSAFSAEKAVLLADWGPTTLFLNGAAPPDPEVLGRLQRRGVHIEAEPILSLEGEPPHLSSMRLADGRDVPVEALYLNPRSRLNSTLAERLGCAIDDGPFGPVIRTDVGKRTTVSGLYAAGDIARAPHNATWAASDGITAAASAHQALVSENSVATLTPHVGQS
jgi:thioredoxin reductase